MDFPLSSTIPGPVPFAMTRCNLLVIFKLKGHRLRLPTVSFHWLRRNHFSHYHHQQRRSDVVPHSQCYIGPQLLLKHSGDSFLWKVPGERRHPLSNKQQWWDLHTMFCVMLLFSLGSWEAWASFYTWWSMPPYSSSQYRAQLLPTFLFSCEAILWRCNSFCLLFGAFDYSDDVSTPLSSHEGATQAVTSDMNFVLSKMFFILMSKVIKKG